MFVEKRTTLCSKTSGAAIDTLHVLAVTICVEYNVWHIKYSQQNFCYAFKLLDN